MAYTTKTSNLSKTLCYPVLFLNFLCLSIFLILGLFVNSSNSQGILVEPQQRSSLGRKRSSEMNNLRNNPLGCTGRHALILDKRECGTCSVQYERESYQIKSNDKNSGVSHYPENTHWIPITVHLKLFQYGYFEFRICSLSNTSTVVDTECLKSNKLKIKETGNTQYYPKSKGWHHINLLLSQEIKCSQCVLQWKYQTNRCKNGNEGRVCGHQMVFYNCADIAFDKLNPNNKTQEQNRNYFQNMVKKQIRKKRNALRFSSKRPQLINTSFHTGNDSGSNVAESFSDTLLTSEHLLPSNNNGHEDELNNFELGSTSGMAPIVFSNYGSGDSFSGDQQSNIFSVQPSVTGLKSHKVNTNLSLTTTRNGSFSGVLVEEELLLITPQPSNAKLNEKINNKVLLKTNDTNKQLTGNINLTIFPPRTIQKYESGANNSVPELFDLNIMRRKKEKKNCTDGSTCFKKHQCMKKIECSNTQNGTTQCVTVESCSLIIDIFQGIPTCRGHRESIRCRGRGIYRYMRGVSSWCENKCRKQDCQLSICNCDCQRIVSCSAVGIFRIVPGSKIWCQINCAHNYCPTTHCGCQ